MVRMRKSQLRWGSGCEKAGTTRGLGVAVGMAGKRPTGEKQRRRRH